MFGDTKTPAGYYFFIDQDIFDKKDFFKNPKILIFHNLNNKKNDSMTQRAPPLPLQKNRRIMTDKRKTNQHPRRQGKPRLIVIKS